MTKAQICETEQVPLKIWTEHSNLPSQGRGDSKTHTTLLGPKGTIQLDIFYILAENSVNSVIRFFLALLQAAII